MADKRLHPGRFLWRNKTVSILTLSHFSHDLCFGILPALLPFIREALNLEYLQAGGLLAALTITAGLAQFLGGWLGDRFPRRWLVFLGLGGVSIGTFSVGLMDSYASLVAIFVVIGLFAGLYHPSAVVLLADSVEARQQGKAMGSHMVGGSVGWMAAPLLGGLIAGLWGWPRAFMLLGIPALFAAMVSSAYLPHRTARVAAGEPRRSGPETPAPWYRLAAVSVSSVLIEIVSGAAIAFFALFLVDVQGLTPTLATLGLGLLRFGSLTGSMLGGFLADVLTKHRAVLFAFITSGPPLLLLSYFTGVPFFVTLFFFGLLYTMRELTVQVYLLKTTPRHLRSRLIGIYYGFGMEGASIIQPFVGHAMDRFGIAGVYLWLGIASTAVSVLLPLLFIIGLRGRR
jgi:MFS transporter, FSR family, fosmidomycin resistance protein